MQTRFHESDCRSLVIVADRDLNNDEPRPAVAELETVDPKLRQVIVDCASVDYLSTPGIGNLVRWHVQMKRRNVAFKVCGLNQKVASVFRAVRLDKLFHIYPDLPSALQAARN